MAEFTNSCLRLLDPDCARLLDSAIAALRLRVKEWHSALSDYVKADSNADPREFRVFSAPLRVRNLLCVVNDLLSDAFDRTGEDVTPDIDVPTGRDDKTMCMGEPLVSRLLGRMPRLTEERRRELLRCFSDIDDEFARLFGCVFAEIYERRFSSSSWDAALVEETSRIVVHLLYHFDYDILEIDVVDFNIGGVA